MLTLEPPTQADVAPAPTHEWHSQETHVVLEGLSSSEAGINAAEHPERLAQYGPNRLATTKKRKPFLSFAKQFHNILIYVLLSSCVVTALLGHYLDSAVILAVVLLNAIIGVIQEGKSEQAMDAIRQMLAPKATVIRDGERQTVDGDQLVPGDIVLLEAGDKVPADLRLILAHGLRVQEAILTGESVPVAKGTQPVEEHAVLGDRSSMAYSGTMVVAGQGKAVVVATGATTEIGRISGLLSEVDTLETPLVQKIDKFARWLTFFILLVSALLLLHGHFLGHLPFDELFMAVVGLAVAAIPEGLPAVMTITLAVGVQAMAKRNDIVRRLPAIETLGSVSVICTDKTGTLTRNEMMVTTVLTRQHEFTVDGEGYSPVGTLKLDDNAVSASDHGILLELAQAAVLCSDASLSEKEGIWQVAGDPMEGALIAFAGKLDVQARMQRSQWTRSDAIPFDSANGYMACLCHDSAKQGVIFVKGAPEQLLAMCHAQRAADGSQESLDTRHWLQRAEQVAAQGQRVLAFASKAVAPDHRQLKADDLKEGLVLLGMVGMIDPPRVEVIPAVSACHNAGIDVKMITGDHASTAVAIGRQIGLKHPDVVMTGPELNQMDDETLASRIEGCSVFARTTPEHKLRLVTALQASGQIIAMTGDGVNDSPALKQADAGIAMGLKGSEAAKEAAELVLTDDHFATITMAVREGRTVYDNIKKVLSWTLPTSVGESMCVIVALLFALNLPMTAIQILWINLVTGITLGLALAFEPTEENTMHRPPRKRNAPLMDKALMGQVILVSVLFLAGIYGLFEWTLAQGHSLALARTVAVNTLVSMEVAYLFFIRSIYGTGFNWQVWKGTRVMWLVVGLITVLQVVFTYAPPLQHLFGTEGMSWQQTGLVVATGLALFVIIESEKALRPFVFKQRQAVN